MVDNPTDLMNSMSGFGTNNIPRISVTMGNDVMMKRNDRKHHEEEEKKVFVEKRTKKRKLTKILTLRLELISTPVKAKKICLIQGERQIWDWIILKKKDKVEQKQGEREALKGGDWKERRRSCMEESKPCQKLCNGGLIIQEISSRKDE